MPKTFGRTSSVLRVFMFTLIGPTACTKKADGSDIPTAPSAEAPVPPSLPSSPASVSPASNDPADAKLSRFFKYQESVAPYVIRLNKIAQDPVNGKDPKKIAKAISADKDMKKFAIVADRALKRAHLTPEDVKKHQAFVTDAQSTWAEAAGSAEPNPIAHSTLGTNHGPQAAALAAKHRADFKRARGALQETDRPIDCGRQPESCSCTECPSGDPCPAYAACVNGCQEDLAKCALENIGPQAFICLIPFNFCALNCQSKCN
ncbi:MAG TPA: hypothetical protein VG734_23160 [Lacunisphaera sp.]|nr:hypothetical protein [Lacunisphaera sp.]